MKEKVMDSPFRTLIGTLLIGGTALGAAMLALPVATAGGGIIPAWSIYLFCWLFSICTGFLFIEIALWLPPKTNIAMMAAKILGGWGKGVVWALYLFLFYSLMVAYVAGGGHFVYQFFGSTCPSWLSTALFAGFFGTFVYLGTRVAGRLNAMLMIGLVIAYLFFIVLGSSHVNYNLSEGHSWWAALMGLPIIFTSFSYQGTVPSVFEYLGRDPRKMRFAIVIGTSIPFFAYIAWDFIIKGIVPVSGPNGLLAAKAAGLTAVDPLQHFLPGTNVHIIGSFFAFFALTTSLIGVAIGLLDFLADSLKVKKTGLNTFGLCSLIFVPPVFISITNPAIFLKALGFGGGFGCVLLLAFIPTLMVWKGRYILKYPSDTRQLSGGKLMLLFLFLAIGLELVIETISLLM